jgi:hypothetical protein
MKSINLKTINLCVNSDNYTKDEFMGYLELFVFSDYTVKNNGFLNFTTFLKLEFKRFIFKFINYRHRSQYNNSIFKKELYLKHDSSLPGHFISYECRLTINKNTDSFIKGKSPNILTFFMRNLKVI